MHSKNPLTDLKKYKNGAITRKEASAELTMNVAGWGKFGNIDKIDYDINHKNMTNHKK